MKHNCPLGPLTGLSSCVAFDTSGDLERPRHNERISTQRMTQVIGQVSTLFSISKVLSLRVELPGHGMQFYTGSGFQSMKSLASSLE